MSKRKTIDAFFKKKDVSNSEFRTPVAVETNVDTSMPDEHPDPSKCSRIQSEEINCDPRSRKQICKFPINKQNKIRRAYLKEGPYQPKYIDYPCNDDNHRRRKSAPPCKKSWLHPWTNLDLRLTPTPQSTPTLPATPTINTHSSTPKTKLKRWQTLNRN